MSLFLESRVRARAQREYGAIRNATAVLTEQMHKQASAAKHDIFLSHAFEDRELVLGVALTIEDLGYSVFIDWRDDPSLDRKNISHQTAEKLRSQIKASRCLFYSTTQHASESKWMPWELGFKDGHNGRAAILPVSFENTDTYEGQQYLGIYPYVTQGRASSGNDLLWINQESNCYVSFDAWLNGKEPTKRS